MDAPVAHRGRKPRSGRRTDPRPVSRSRRRTTSTRCASRSSADAAFNWPPTPRMPPVALVNKALVRNWGRRDPIGTRVSVDSGETWTTRGRRRRRHVRQFSLEKEPEAQVYIPLTQSPMGPARPRARAHAGRSSRRCRQIIRAVVHDVDPNMPVKNISTLEELRGATCATPKLTAVLLVLFAGVALLVTMSGPGGVMATSVSQRTQEFGVRLALGARPAVLVRGVLRQGAGLLSSALGSAGIAGASAAGRVLTRYFSGYPREANVVTVSYPCPAHERPGRTPCHWRSPRPRPRCRRPGSREPDRRFLPARLAISLARTSEKIVGRA